MAGEKRKEEEMEMVLGPLDGAPTPNREILPVINSLEAIFVQWKKEGKIGKEKEEDSWLYYLHGILLAKHGNEGKAKEYFMKSLEIYPWNWGAWLELGHLIGTLEEVRLLLLAMETSTANTRPAKVVRSIPDATRSLDEEYMAPTCNSRALSAFRRCS